MDWLEIVTVLSRGSHVAASLSLFGYLVFRRFVVPRTAEGVQPGIISGIGFVSAWLALALGGIWLAAVSGAISGAHDLASLFAAVPVVAGDTGFGRLLCLRLLLLAVVLVLLPRRNARWSGGALLAAGVALALQPLLGHIGALQDSVRVALIPIEIAHLLAAGAWLGGLIPLLLCVVRTPPALAATLCERFTPVGLIAVGTIAVTALPQAGELIGGMPELFGTWYGHMALFKLGLFVLALGLACVNRLVLTTRLRTGVARRALIGSIAIETIAVVCVVLAAAAMASSPPATHVQPVWPFPWRLSTVAWEEPELRQELVRLLIVAAAGFLLIGVSLAFRRFRVLAVCVAAIGVTPFLPALRLLLVDAWPSSYARSATGFSVMAIARGQTVFGQQCAVCHDPKIGSGDVGDLTASHIWGHLDGELFWWVTSGVNDPDGAALMPAFASMLSENDRWALIDFIHARNVGMQAVVTGKWSPPVPAPAMPLNCDGGEVDSLADIGTHDLLIAAEADPPVAAQSSISGAETIRLVRDAVGVPGEGECVAASPVAWEAWRVLSGVPREHFGGWRALVDSRGWLRAWLPPGSAPEAVAATLRDANEHSIATDTRREGAHRH